MVCDRAAQARRGGDPATNLLTTKDFVYRFNAADVKGIVCTALGDVTRFVDEAQPKSPSLQVKLVAHGGCDAPGWQNFDELVEQASDEFARVDTKATDPMLLYFTSGTTGYPKMVVHDYTYSLAHIPTAKHWHNIPAGGLHLTISDTGWGKAAWGKLYGQWAIGATVFVYDFDKFIPHDMLTIIQKYRISTFCAPPTMYRFFIKEGIENYDLSSLQYATIAGEALNPEVYNRFYEYTGLKLMEGFGQTETTLLIANLPGMTKPGSMGKPTPYNVDLVDEDGNSVANGRLVKLWFAWKRAKSSTVCFGLPRREDQGGWHDGLYHTGDTAWRDEDGYLVCGRTDDVIKASGYRIGPFEIESV
ncbi:MAG: AMP-binding protein [Oscillospiraceae bacterium]